jgi:hypothetical protein
VIAKFVYQIGTFAGLIRELKRNGSLRRMVGIDSRARVPIMPYKKPRQRSSSVLGVS